MTRHLLPLVASSLVALALVGCSAPVTAVEQRSMTVDHWSDQSLDIETANGRIEVVREARGDVAIEARIVAGGASTEQAEERAAATAVTATRETNGALVVRTVFPAPGTNRDSASLRIVVPDAAEVVARSSNGGVRIDGVTGPVRISTSNGAVDVTGIGGPVDIDTSNGAVRVSDSTGATTVTTSNGGVVAINAGWPLSIRTSNGGITVESAGPGVGTLEARTSNGSVSFGGSGAGAIRSSTSRGRMSLVFDETGPRSTLRSSNGSIRVRLGEPTANPSVDRDDDTD